MTQTTENGRIPAYRLHRPSGQARVIIGGKHRYLGRFGSAESKAKYGRLVAELSANGSATPVAATQAPDLSVAELLARYWRFADGYYRKAGKATSELACIRAAFKAARELYGRTPAGEFSPLYVKALQQHFIAAGLSRRTINLQVDRIKRLFKWSASEGLTPPSIYHALQCVPGLRAGRSKAKELPPRQPVADSVVEATLPFLPAVVADVVRLQRLLGCRSGELLSMRPGDIDRTTDPWVYVPQSHKTEHHGKRRMIYIGPRAQEILLNYLLRASDSPCFSPIDSEAKRRADQHENRKTPLSCGNRPGSNRKRRPKRTAGTCYSVNAFRRAIARGVELANRQRPADDQLPAWFPHQLRHAAATELRRMFGIEAAACILGHSNLPTAEIYAAKNEQQAAAIAKQIG